MAMMRRGAADGESGDLLQHFEPFRCRCPIALAARLSSTIIKR